MYVLVCVFCMCCVCVLVCCVWCGTLKTSVCRFKTPPCVPAKRPCHTSTHRQQPNTNAPNHPDESLPLVHKPPTWAANPILFFQRQCLSACWLDTRHVNAPTTHNTHSQTDRQTETDGHSHVPTDRQKDRCGNVCVSKKQFRTSTPATLDDFSVSGTCSSQLCSGTRAAAMMPDRERSQMSGEIHKARLLQPSSSFAAPTPR